MKLELIALPGQPVDAVLAREFTARDTEQAVKAADRLLGTPARVNYDPELSYQWSCSVYCTAEFSAWWRAREGKPAIANRIFLEGLN